MNSTQWIEEIMVLAQTAASFNEVPVGALVMYQDKIIGRGYNQREQLQDPIAHAEILALQEAAHELKTWKLKGCHLYTSLEPCLLCLAACQQARISSVTFCAYDLKAGAISLGYAFHEDLKTNHRFPVIHHSQPECGLMISSFFKQLRNKNK